jgi:serine/threonine-protein kinase HipA
MSTGKRTPIFVSLDLGSPELCGTLWVEQNRGKEIFSFEYSQSWLKIENRLLLDPSLGLHQGPQYTQGLNFGIFLDSAPDRWGRFLIKRREAVNAREQKRPIQPLKETDYLLGVHDTYRVGALRFQKELNGRFLDHNNDLAAPPITSLRKLEHASLQIEKDDAEQSKEYTKWLKMLIAPGGSLGGARPKASVVDETGALWLAKFPSRTDSFNVGAWEMVVHELGMACDIQLPEARIEKFSSRHHTFLVKRFDRTAEGNRIFFMSAMTALGKNDGDDATTGVSYLHLAELLMRFGSHCTPDLHELWRRIAFHTLVSNTDDHLRNHGFLIDSNGWRLSPAYDLNPNPDGDGLKLNISEDDNSQNLEILIHVAKYFRITATEAKKQIRELQSVVSKWRTVASKHELSRAETERMTPAFRLCENKSSY